MKWIIGDIIVQTMSLRDGLADCLRSGKRTKTLRPLNYSTASLVKHVLDCIDNRGCINTIIGAQYLL